MTWDFTALSLAPEWVESPEHSVGVIKAIFYAGLPWRGKPTQVFAYYGQPEVAAGEKVPAMVLVHGGGGSAFIPWVQLWISRGYAAIAMDTCGCISGGGHENHPRHENGGPAGWGGFDQLDQSLRDQWSYHAVADVLLGHSLMRSFPNVDAAKIGITGISWGGYLTCIAASVDPRFRFAAPVYGCGFLGDNSTWLDQFRNMGAATAQKWLSNWDPAVYLPHANLPMLWVTGTNDFAFPLDSLQKSYRLPSTLSTLCVRVNMPHGHGGAGENPEEIHAMANAVLKGGSGLAHITAQGCEENCAWVTFTSPSPILQAELNYTTDRGDWVTRNWQTVPAHLAPDGNRASALLPPDVAVYYFNLTDTRQLVVSSEHTEIATP